MKRPGLAVVATKHLRAWREKLELGRPEVVARLAELYPESPAFDQATLAKWESGETPIRSTEMWALGRVYKVHAMWLFLPPGVVTERQMRAAKVAKTLKNHEAQAWLCSGEAQIRRSKHIKAKASANVARATAALILTGANIATSAALTADAADLRHHASTLVQQSRADRLARACVA